MINLSLEKISKITNGTLLGNNINIKRINFDTRNIQENCLFIALKGKTFDAHNFINDDLTKKISSFLVHKYCLIKRPQIIVNDTKFALGKIAHWIRNNTQTRIVALTGSSGKTSVKEMAAKIFCMYGNTLYTKKNFNSDFGVPITLLDLNAKHKYAVIELGTNYKNEIEYTANIVNPEVALINNIAVAHLENFGSLKQIAIAKGKIFNTLPDYGTAIINDDSHYWSYWKKKLNNKKVWRFSVKKNNKTNFWASNIIFNKYNTSFKLHTPVGSTLINLSLVGLHNISNAIAASALAISVNIPLKIVQKGLNNFKAIPGRLFFIHLKPNKILIDDSYNANVSSVKVAINLLNKMPGFKVMVIGDMAELGNKSFFYHSYIGKIIRFTKINKILSFGTLSKYISDISGKGEHFYDQNKLIIRLNALISQHISITTLVKGSRINNMDKIVTYLRKNIKC